MTVKFLYYSIFCTLNRIVHVVCLTVTFGNMCISNKNVDAINWLCRGRTKSEKPAGPSDRHF